MTYSDFLNFDVEFECSEGKRGECKTTGSQSGDSSGTTVVLGVSAVIVASLVIITSLTVVSTLVVVAAAVGFRVGVD